MLPHVWNGPEFRKDNGAIFELFRIYKSDPIEQLSEEKWRLKTEHYFFT